MSSSLDHLTNKAFKASFPSMQCECPGVTLPDLSRFVIIIRFKIVLNGSNSVDTVE